MRPLTVPDQATPSSVVTVAPFTPKQKGILLRILHLLLQKEDIHIHTEDKILSSVMELEKEANRHLEHSWRSDAKDSDSEDEDDGKSKEEEEEEEEDKDSESTEDEDISEWEDIGEIASIISRRRILTHTLSGQPVATLTSLLNELDAQEKETTQVNSLTNSPLVKKSDDEKTQKLEYLFRPFVFFLFTLFSMPLFQSANTRSKADSPLHTDQRYYAHGVTSFTTTAFLYRTSDQMGG